MKLTYKYKLAAKNASKLLFGMLCAYSVCACGGAQHISPVNTNPDNDQANTQYEPDPTDTGSDKPGNQDKPDEQNNQNDQDTPVEQPDEHHQETPNDQDIPETPDEQPDEDIPENPSDQDIPETPDEQPDQDVPVDPSGACHSEGCQGDHGCKAGYVWVGKYASNFVDTGGDPDYNCVPCVAVSTLAERLRQNNHYCPGGDDLESKFSVDLSNQTEKCPEYTHVNDLLSDCVCELGVPPPPKEECYPHTTRKKPLIIKPKVNVVRRNNSTTQLLLRNKVHERKINKR